jgi:uncharacterized membrane protein
MDQFFMGALAMASLVTSLFFLRFWRDTGDRLFAMFAAAFGALSLTRVVLAWVPQHSESRSFIYWIRLVAFVLILIAIIDKNRGRK